MDEPQRTSVSDVASRRESVFDRNGGEVWAEEFEDGGRIQYVNRVNGNKFLTRPDGFHTSHFKNEGKPSSFEELLQFDTIDFDTKWTEVLKIYKNNPLFLHENEQVQACVFRKYSAAQRKRVLDERMKIGPTLYEDGDKFGEFLARNTADIRCREVMLAYKMEYDFHKRKSRSFLPFVSILRQKIEDEKDARRSVLDYDTFAYRSRQLKRMILSELSSGRLSEKATVLDVIEYFKENDVATYLYGVGKCRLKKMISDILLWAARDSERKRIHVDDEIEEGEIV